MDDQTFGTPEIDDNEPIDDNLSIDQAKGIQENFEQQHPLPDFLDKNDLRSRVMRFARMRYGLYTYLDDSLDLFDPFRPASQFFNLLIREYPFPLTKSAIIDTCKRNGWQFERDINLLVPLSQEEDSLYAGTAAWLIGETRAICYVIGIVQPNFVWESPVYLSGFSAEDYDYFQDNVTFTFVDSIVIYDGKFDKPLLLRIEELIKRYNKMYLGKTITGRPISNATEGIIEAARKAIKEHPLDKQLMIANEIGIGERTLQFHIKRSKYKNFQDLHDSVTKTE